SAAVRLPVPHQVSNPPASAVRAGDASAQARQRRALGGVSPARLGELRRRRVEDIAPAFGALQGRADALYVAADYEPHSRQHLGAAPLKAPMWPPGRLGCTLMSSMQAPNATSMQPLQPCSKPTRARCPRSVLPQSARSARHTGGPTWSSREL